MSAADPPPPGLERIAATFRRFGEAEAPANRSRIYERLSFAVAESPELCELASHTRPGQMPPNMLFAAVQYLLEEQPEHGLAAFYPSFGGHDPGDPGPAFAEFCRLNRRAIIPILQTRMVQTNEVRRSALLLPAFATAAAEAGRPLALIEIGPSAGLNLLFDRFRFDYGGGVVAGDPASPVLLDCESRLERLPLTDGIPAVASRCGIDLNPLDVTDPADVRWLKALVWPDHDDRRALLSAAAEIAREHPPRLLEGDIFDLVPGEVRKAPSDAAVCIFATFVFVQFTAETLAHLRDLVLGLSHERETWMVVIPANGFGGVAREAGPTVSAWLFHFARGEMTTRRLAVCNPHGRWIEWGATGEA